MFYVLCVKKCFIYGLGDFAACQFCRCMRALKEMMKKETRCVLHKKTLGKFIFLYIL